MLRREISEGNGNGKLWMTRQAAVATRGKKAPLKQPRERERPAARNTAASLTWNPGGRWKPGSKEPSFDFEMRKKD
jgi:hypothetical protein